MIIETKEAVLLEEDEDLAAALMGGIWSDFKESIPPLQAKGLTEAFNLILLSQPLDLNDPSTNMPDVDDDDFMSNRTGSAVPTLVTNVLVDDNTHTPEKKNAVYQIITGNIIEILKSMGFVLDDDVASQDTLSAMCKMVSFFYDLQEYEDLIGLGDLLDSQDIPPKDRYLLCMERYLGEGTDLSDYEVLIVDVSEVTLKAIRDSLKQEDLDSAPPQSLIDRVLKNRELLEPTLAFAHIRNNGQLGGSVSSFLNFYHRELEELLDEETEASQVQYGLEVIGFFMISELNNPFIKDRLVKHFSGVINDHIASLKIEKLINKLEGLE